MRVAVFMWNGCLFFFLVSWVFGASKKEVATTLKSDSVVTFPDAKMSLTLTGLRTSSSPLNVHKPCTIWAGLCGLLISPW